MIFVEVKNSWGNVSTLKHLVAFYGLEKQDCEK